MIGRLTWVNRASTNTDQNFNVQYSFTLDFAGPGNSDTVNFNLNIQQFTNVTGDVVFNLLQSTLNNLGPFNVAGVVVSDIKFQLASGTNGTYNPGYWPVEQSRPGDSQGRIGDLDYEYHGRLHCSRARSFHLGDDDPGLRRRWLHGLSPPQPGFAPARLISVRYQTLLERAAKLAALFFWPRQSP